MNQICSLHGINLRRLRYYGGYFAKYGLIPHNKNFIPDIIVNDPIQYFKELGKRATEEIAREKYGWSSKDYWYYYFDQSVQKYLKF
ncbi:hypothetical protein GC096_08310 [Paenibacillus sp. LMG 31461]|uniref:Uncharacterized protein n=1 Tax=Paenibacillus plantarum TaxID=2654975 RepID=A0ABX1X7Q6_9BACL|nr:hypothetical protein [Paenibacillus plantarum]NOU64025.1 hypothetical protein [Paenibacillus plantarum]